MKKIKVLIITLFSTIVLFGCAETSEKIVYVDEEGNEIKTEIESETVYSRFQIIEEEWSYTILKDKETECEYVYINGSHAGGLSPIYENSNKIKGCKNDE